MARSPSQSQYHIVYPRDTVQRLDGGLNNKFEPSLISENESPDCLNVSFRAGAVETRQGTTKLNTTSVGTFACDGLYTRRDTTGAESLCAFHGGKLRVWNVNTFVTVPSAVSVFTAGIRVAGAQYNNNIFFGNGNVIPQRYDGSNFFRHGVYAPSNTVSYLTNGAGAVSAGTASYYITFLNSYVVESDVSTGVTITLAASSVVSLTSIPLAPTSWGVSSRRIYRSSNGTAKKLLTTISDNTTTIYTDNTDTLSLGVTAPTDNGVPPKFSVCLYHQNRLFVNDAANPNYVWYSEIGAPYTFPSGNFFKVGDNASDLVKGLAVYNDAIVVLCENSQWINYMPDEADANWTRIRVKSSFGSRSHYGTFSFNNFLVFAAIQNSKFVGFAAIVGDTIAPTATLLTTSSMGSYLLSDRIEPDMFQVQETYVPNISAVVYKNKAYISVTFGDLNTTNNRVYILDFSIQDLSQRQKETWTPLKGIDATQFSILSGNLYAGSSDADGFVNQLEASAYSDNGTAIDSYFWTKEYSGNKGHENFIKDFRRIKFLADLSGSFFMTLRWRVDSDPSMGQSKNISLAGNTAIWGSGIWGTMIWGSAANQFLFDIPLAQTFGKRIQFRFDNQNIANQHFKVHRMNFVYNVRGTT